MTRIKFAKIVKKSSGKLLHSTYIVQTDAQYSLNSDSIGTC